MNKDMIIAVYGVLQMELKQEKVLTPLAVPIKDKNYPASTQDALAIYKFLAEKLRGVTESEINKRKDSFNNIVKGLEQEYLLNMSLFAIFMMENLLMEDGSKVQQGIMLPKINRLIDHLTEGILREQQEVGKRVVKDSKIGASNVMRVFRGEPELTKKMREWNKSQWK